MGIKRILGWSERPLVDDATVRGLRVLEDEASLMAARRDAEDERLKAARAELEDSKRRAAGWSLMFVGLNAFAMLMVTSLWRVIDGQVSPSASLLDMTKEGWEGLRLARDAPYLDDPWLLGTIAGFVVTALWSLRSDLPERWPDGAVGAEGAREQMESALQWCLMGCVPAAMFLAVPAKGEMSVGRSIILLVLAWLAALTTWHMGTPKEQRWRTGPLMEAEGRYAIAQSEAQRRRVEVEGLGEGRFTLWRQSALVLEICFWPVVLSAAGLLYTPYTDLYLLCAGALILTLAVVLPGMMKVAVRDGRGKRSRWTTVLVGFALLPYVLAWPVLAWVLWRVDVEPVLLTAAVCFATVYALGRYRRYEPKLELENLNAALRRQRRASD